jgi:ferritin-like metal-binding protein YciE
MQEESLRTLFLMKLRDLYDAERQITKALPKMVKKAHNQDLINALEEHLGETEDQVERLEQVFEELGEKPKGHDCLAMEGLLNEGKEMLQLRVEDDALDVMIVNAAQSVEHYEIAGYATALSYADLLGFDNAADLLEQTLEEEEAADDKLSDLLDELLTVEDSEEEEGDEA